jgi:hypothetical protein
MMRRLQHQALSKGARSGSRLTLLSGMLLIYPAALEQYGKQPYEVPVYIYAGDDNWNHVSEKEDLPEDSCKYNMDAQAVILYQHLHRSNLFNRPFEKWEEVLGSPAELRILNGGHDTNL